MQGIVGGKEKIFCIPTRLGITEDQYVEILSVAAGSLAGMEQERSYRPSLWTEDNIPMRYQGLTSVTSQTKHLGQSCASTRFQFIHDRPTQTILNVESKDH